jgi:hypothetical protein
VGIGARVCQVPPICAAAAPKNVSQKNNVKIGNVFFIRRFMCAFFGGIKTLHHLPTGKKTQSSQNIHKNS